MLFVKICLSIQTYQRLYLPVFYQFCYIIKYRLLNNKDIRDEYIKALRNKFDALQKTETRTLNEKYENFVNAYLEAAAKYKPTKHRTKSRVPWETLAVREKRADMKIASKCPRKNTTNAKALKLKKGPR